MLATTAWRQIEGRHAHAQQGARRVFNACENTSNAPSQAVGRRLFPPPPCHASPPDPPASFPLNEGRLREHNSTADRAYHPLTHLLPELCASVPRPRALSGRCRLVPAAALPTGSGWTFNVPVMPPCTLGPSPPTDAHMTRGTAPSGPPAARKGKTAATRGDGCRPGSRSATLPARFPSLTTGRNPPQMPAGPAK